MDGQTSSEDPETPFEVNKTFAVNKYERELDDDEMTAKVHRRMVGGLWEQIGRLQYDYLREQGMQPHHRMLDVGCGALRAGVHLAGYLDPGHYYGVDVNASLLRAAREVELPDAGISDRVPEENLRQTDLFDVDFGVEFDVALAQSLFTHLPLNHFRLCLWRLGEVMAPHGRFFVTVNVFRRHPMQAMRRQVEDPYSYRPSDMTWLADETGWHAEWLGDWGHPRGQQMVVFTRERQRRRTLVQKLVRPAGRG